ncbi:MAG: hypothetical protein ISS36_04695 [Candidatus Aenigmarchaeota archaeon]|nr:hypothetical protein [Candidatus Aenigmarchaeota archaeon]
MTFIVKIDCSKCDGRSDCKDVCPVEIYADPKDGKCIVDPAKAKETKTEGSVVSCVVDECIGCRACEAACAKEAIKIEEKE